MSLLFFHVLRMYLGETYTWSNVNCVVHNIIVGSLWMEHTGNTFLRIPYELFWPWVCRLVGRSVIIPKRAGSFTSLLLSPLLSLSLISLFLYLLYIFPYLSLLIPLSQSIYLYLSHLFSFLPFCLYRLNLDV